MLKNRTAQFDTEVETQVLLTYGLALSEYQSRSLSNVLLRNDRDIIQQDSCLIHTCVDMSSSVDESQSKIA